MGTPPRLEKKYISIWRREESRTGDRRQVSGQGNNHSSHTANPPQPLPFVFVQKIPLLGCAILLPRQVAENATYG
jgi:hypothetical protein